MTCLSIRNKLQDEVNSNRKSPYTDLHKRKFTVISHCSIVNPKLLYTPKADPEKVIRIN
jgi:hypothetical protein